MQAKDVVIPAALLAGGLVLFAALGYWHAGAEGAAAVTIWVGLQVVISGALGILGCFIAAALLKISFGPIQIAALKIAAIIVTGLVVSTLLPIFLVGWIIAIVVYIGMLIWLFELDGQEAVYTALIIWVTQFVANFLLAVVLLAITGA